MESEVNNTLICVFADLKRNMSLKTALHIFHLFTCMTRQSLQGLSERPPSSGCAPLYGQNIGVGNCFKGGASLMMTSERKQQENAPAVATIQPEEGSTRVSRFHTIHREIKTLCKNLSKAAL